MQSVHDGSERQLLKMYVLRQHEWLLLELSVYVSLNVTFAQHDILVARV